MSNLNQKIFIFGADYGASKQGACLGPSMIQLLDTANNGNFFVSRELFSIEPFTCNNFQDTRIEFKFAKHVDKIYELYLQTTIPLIEFLSANKQNKAIVFSGDHSLGLSAIIAMSKVSKKSEIGVIWVDAHADLHSPYSTPSGNVHGMPLGAALGIMHSEAETNQLSNEVENYWKKIVNLGHEVPMIDHNNLVFVSLRDYELHESNTIQKHSIPFFSPEQIKTIGIEQVCKEISNKLSNCSNKIISFDVDSIDSSIVQGTGTPAPHGLTIDEATYLLQYFINDPTVKVIEFTEINPLLEIENKTAKLIYSIISKVF